MAGFNVAGLPAFLQYQGQLQQQEQAKQEQQMRMQQWQQSQQDRQRQQAAMAAAGNALPQLLQGGMPAQQPQGQMPPPPQPPAPGQPSQSQQPPQGMPLPGQGMPPGQAQVNQPPLPQGQPQQPPPFRPMPTSPPPQQQAAPAAIAPPPQAPQQPQGQPNPADDQMEGGFSLQRIVKSGQDQGLSGSDLMAYMQTFEPYMTAQQKAKSEGIKTQIELKKLDAEIQAHQIAASNQQLSLAERMKHDDALEKLASRRADISQQSVDIRARKGTGGAGGAAPAAPAENVTPDASGNLPEPKGVAGFSPQAIKALGEDYAVRGPTALAGFGYKNLPPAARAEIVNYAAAKNAATGGNFASNKIQYAADTAGARVNAQQAAKTDAAANALTSPGGIGDQFQQSIDALNRTGIPIANQVQMEALRKTFDPRVSAYDTAMNGVVSEAAQILGRGTITVNSMEEARKVVNGWHTSEQAKAGLAQIKREAATTVKASSEEVAKSARTPKGQPGIGNGPAVGTVEGGYRFKGGDPSQQSNWEKQ
jgi:hypothetical protein